MATAFFARQPIVDLAGAVTAYELLHRSGPEAESAVVENQVDATRQVIGAAFGPIDVFDGRRAFVNVPRSMIVDGSLLDLDPSRVGLEILEGVPTDRAVLDGLAVLRGAGFVVALDDFRPDQGRGACLPLADLVKVDVLATPPDELQSVVAHLADHGVVSLAEKVESETLHRRCLDLGFELFQGFHLGRPEPMTGRAPGPLVEAMLEMVGSTDPGLDRVAALLMSSPAGQSLSHGLSRGRLCQRIADRFRHPDPGSYFVVGALSVMGGRVSGEGFDSDVVEALRGTPGPKSAVLDTAIAIERGDWERLRRVGVDPSVFADEYARSLAWAGTIVAQVA